jgi:hypothetical protein
MSNRKAAKMDIVEIRLQVLHFLASVYGEDLPKQDLVPIAEQICGWVLNGDTKENEQTVVDI